ncbi:MAG: single-stranded DNA-binding protein [Myxacorys californica WJT36-NPBG1]|jgi:single-stranded DNA-binding protein|nr:single-stranded DNA-binding protein [Myxacorys californica WJT36-NPBG1]
MNSCILLAEIIEAPQLRYTSDNQTPITEMQVQFAGLRPEDPPATVKAVGWGNMAQEIQGNYHQGDRVILEGRLGMNTVDRPEGFKEKRAELTIQKIYSLDGASIGSVSSASAPAPAPSAPPTAKPKATKAPAAPAPVDQPELDDIPF